MAAQLSQSLEWVSQRVQLQKLNPAIQDLVNAGQISVAKGVMIAKLPSEEQDIYAAKAQSGISPQEFMTDISGRIKQVKEAEKQGVKVVASEFTNDKATDFMAILTSIKAKKPDAIFYGGMYGQAGPMLRQMAQLGMNEAKLLGGDGICVPELAKVAASGDPAAIKAQFGKTGGTCKACHDAFRKD